MAVYPTSLDIENYVILQNTDDYAFSQDSVFLANMAKIGKTDKILDLGCGSGILATLALVKKHASSAVGIGAWLRTPGWRGRRARHVSVNGRTAL